MAQVIWQGDAVAIAQVGTVTVSSVDSTPADNTYTLTVTDENGYTVAVSVVGDTNVNTTAAALNTAWNASASPVAQRVTSAIDGTTASKLVLTANTAGVPFTIASSVAGGGTGAFGAYTAVTANSGANDYNTAENWNTGSVPAATWDVAILGKYDVPILYGLNQSAISIHEFIVESGFTSAIGGTDSGYLKLLLGADSFKFAGRGTSYIDVGASAINPVINNTASPASGRHGLYWKGTATPNFYLNKGYVGFGVEPGNVAKCDTFHVGYVGNQRSDANLAIGLGAVDVAGSGNPDVVQAGGHVVAQCDIDAVTVFENAGTYTQENGRWTTATLGGGLIYPDGDGTYVTTNFVGPAELLNTRTLVAKTFTNLNIYHNGATILDPHAKITWGSAWDAPNIKTDACVFDFGPSRKIAITAS
jgi:hypothetical protein